MSYPNESLGGRACIQPPTLVGLTFMTAIGSMLGLCSLDSQLKVFLVFLVGRSRTKVAKLHSLTALPVVRVMAKNLSDSEVESILDLLAAAGHSSDLITSQGQMDFHIHHRS